MKRICFVSLLLFCFSIICLAGDWRVVSYSKGFEIGIKESKSVRYIYSGTLYTMVNIKNGLYTNIYIEYNGSIYKQIDNKSKEGSINPKNGDCLYIIIPANIENRSNGELFEAIANFSK